MDQALMSGTKDHVSALRKILAVHSVVGFQGDSPCFLPVCPTLLFFPFFSSNHVSVLRKVLSELFVEFQVLDDFSSSCSSPVVEEVFRSLSYVEIPIQECKNTPNKSPTFGLFWNLLFL